MFNLKQKNEVHPLDAPISSLTKELEHLTVGGEAYTNAATTLKILTETRNADKSAPRNHSVNPELLITAATHLAGIAMILGFEKANVITSKSLGFIPRIKS